MALNSTYESNNGGRIDKANKNTNDGNVGYGTNKSSTTNTAASGGTAMHH